MTARIDFIWIKDKETEPEEMSGPDVECKVFDFPETAQDHQRRNGGIVIERLTTIKYGVRSVTLLPPLKP